MGECTNILRQMPCKVNVSKCGVGRRIAEEVSSQKATDVVQSKGPGKVIGPQSTDTDTGTKKQPAKKQPEKPKPAKKK